MSSLTHPTNSSTFILASSKSNPVSFFTDSASFKHNHSKLRWTNRVKFSHENTSDPFGFAEIRTREMGPWWFFFGPVVLRKLEKNGTPGSGFGLYGTEVRFWSVEFYSLKRVFVKESSSVSLSCVCWSCGFLKWNVNVIQLGMGAPQGGCEQIFSRAFLGVRERWDFLLLFFAIFVFTKPGTVYSFLYLWWTLAG